MTDNSCLVAFQQKRRKLASTKSMARRILLIFLLTGLYNWVGLAAGQIYFVLGSDTAVWNAPGGINIGVRSNRFSPALYSDPAGRASQAMDPAWRSKFSDSFGNPLKLTWWMLVGSVYGQSQNLDVPIPNLMPLHLMRHYHGDAIRQLGDELTLHYHTFRWTDYLGTGVYYWNQAKTFTECRGDFDKAIAQSLIEESTFTVTFRSGWHYMDNDWQTYMDRLWPFNMDNDSPNKGVGNLPPFFNVLDWSKAPTNFVPFHPSATNYQRPGNEPAWNVRSIKTPNVTQGVIDGIFDQADAGIDQVVSLWAHLPEAFFLSDMERMDQYLQISAANHPGVQFRYCTAVEAMQRWLGTATTQPPELKMSWSGSSNAVVLNIATDRAIFQASPFVAYKDTSENYAIAVCIPTGTNQWIATLPLPSTSLAMAAVAVTDPVGNLTTREIRWAPEDLFLDTHSDSYREVSGAWTNSQASVWYSTSRASVLRSNQSASAEWRLPVTESRPYSIFVQVPRYTNAAPSTWELWAGDRRISQKSYPTGTPEGWARVATEWLSSTTTNRLTLTGNGPNSSATASVLATAVVRVTPLTTAEDPVLGEVLVDGTPGASTLSLVWSTSTACPTVLDFGAGLQFDLTIATAAAPSTRHVVTLPVPGPGVTMQYRIRSAIPNDVVTHQGQFTTPDPLPPEIREILPMTNRWKFTAENLDGIPWQSPNFDDSAWNQGNGLLWIDVRSNGPNDLVQPKGELLPLDPSTGFPFRTYYFRSPFPFTGDPANVRLHFTNYIDDGAILYLNGAEIWRNHLPLGAAIQNKTLADGYNCGGDATCTVDFLLAEGGRTNLVRGTNWIAAEVHNYDAKSPDITFGLALSVEGPALPPSPVLKVLGDSAGVTTLYWNGTQGTLQESVSLDPSAIWAPIPAAVSPYLVPSGGSRFFRLAL